MEITIKLTSDQVSALQDFLSTQTEQVQNQLTGNVSIRPRYASVDSFLSEQVSTIVSNALRMYPPASVQAELEKIKAAESRIKEAAKVEPVIPA
ncbi:hypothetical protein UFOVP398_13 [uncultured Caudovirales phage]|uniref:Uncharacterized protein n=1 Tax=uncultured Caudovirales phage TaxID=2100421 RepID=A0A6J5M429_9CAUD|nr:hypothetical protein UFOVP398_13 [uncultured Caudovirales phage]